MDEFDYDYEIYEGEDYNTFEENCLDEDRFLGEYESDADADWRHEEGDDEATDFLRDEFGSDLLGDGDLYE